MQFLVKLARMTLSLLSRSVRLLACISLLGTAGNLHAAVKKTNAATADSTVVMTDKGPVRGLTSYGVREFKGIPYAAPPVSNLRWELPHERKPWEDTLDATKFGASCPQVARYGLTEASYDEDCLTLNVTVPIAAATHVTSKKLPVLVWIHGGAFVGGSSALYPLDHMAIIGNLIVVSMNYRLGVFGFMAHPAFDRSTDGDYGQADQRQALRWVQRNIAAFGGDPGNVTLAGESAGAASVCMQMLAPVAAKGLFQKAIVQSAGCVQHLRTLNEGNQIGLKVAAEVGCNNKASALACMRSKPVRQLLEAAAKVAGSDTMTFAPSVGSNALPLQGAVAMATGQFLQVPMINGGDRDELRLYVAYAAQAGQHVTPENYAASLNAVYGDKTPLVLAKYPLNHFSSAPSALGRVMSDFTPDNGLNNCVYLETAKLASKYIKVYEYEFADPNPPPVTEDPGFEMGAVHSSELPYQFPHFSNTSKLDGPDLSPGAQTLSDHMLRYWTSFAATGVPRDQEAIAWIPFETGSHIMRFDQGKIGYFDAAAEHHCSFWQELYPNLLSR
jgi:para-nitrobenzyl esterase